MALNELILELNEIGAVKFGSFTLKSGQISPIYVDLRLIVSYPKLLKKISELLWKKIHHLQFKVLCGVPYAALPVATCISLTHDIPMILQRKEVKEHGTKRRIEGVFEKGWTCLVIEDVVTLGSSILETKAILNEEGLQVTDIAILIDRQQGGVQRLEKAGLKIHALLTLTEILNVLVEQGMVSKEMDQKVQDFLKSK